MQKFKVGDKVYARPLKDVAESKALEERNPGIGYVAGMYKFMEDKTPLKITEVMDFNVSEVDPRYRGYRYKCHPYGYIWHETWLVSARKPTWGEL